MHPNRALPIALLLAILLTACGQRATSPTPPASSSTQLPAGVGTPATTVLSTAPPLLAGLLEGISLDSLLGYLEDLTEIQAYSGWRSSATQGEAEALDYVEDELSGLDYLLSLGMAVERQTFRVYNATEIWESRLFLTVAGRETEVPAEGIRGNRDDNALARRFDSDGVLGDDERNPVTANGAVRVLRSHGEVEDLGGIDLRGTVVFLDYAAIDSIALGSPQADVSAGADLLSLHPAAMVLVTRDSDRLGESHGTFVGDSNPLTRTPVSPEAPAIPIVYVRLEDLAPAGVRGWDDLEDVTQAEVTWDADVFSPALSGNRIAHIPGRDPSRAVILSAHIDSPNSPGALDDGSGSAILLEMARVLNAAQVQPPVDLYLAWFGSEELGLYGSSYFSATHQELLDRTTAMLQIDMLSRPLNGLEADITLVGWSYELLGETGLPWPERLRGSARAEEIAAETLDVHMVYSDNSTFAGFDVPNADMIYMSPEMEQYGPVHYATHIHDPYDTLDQVVEVGDVFEEMARLAMLAIFEAGQEGADLRLTPAAEDRAVFVGSHTEATWMTPVGLIELGQTLAMGGFDVDLISFGQPVTSQDLQGAELVVVLPVIDFSDTEADDAGGWTETEIAALEQYAAQGGLVVISNSAHRLKFFNRPWETNEDWRDMNVLAERFGVEYQDLLIRDETAMPERGVHPLMEGVPSTTWISGNGRTFTMRETGLVLVLARGQVVVGWVPYGEAGGEILVLADVGLLGSTGDASNLSFWQSLARYARSRE